MHATYPKASPKPRFVVVLWYVPSFVWDYRRLPNNAADI